MKNKMIGISIICLMLISNLVLLNDNNISDIIPIVDIDEKQEEYNIPNFDDTIISQAPVDNNWYSGETFKTSITFPKSTYDFSSVQISMDDEIGDDDYYGFTQDVTYINYVANNSDGDQYTYVYAYFYVDTIRTGDIHYSLQCLAKKLTGWLSGTKHTDTFSLSSDYIQANGKTLFLVTSQQYWSSGNEWVFFTMTIQAQKNDGTFVTLVSGLSSNTITTTFTVAHLQGALKIYNFYHQADNIIEYTKIEYKYSSDIVKTGKLQFYNPAYETTVVLNLPLNWEYASITPFATTSFLSNDLTISNTIPTFYTVLFTSKSSNLLAIADFSTDYLTNVGFETGEYLTDWTVNYGNLSMNSQTVFEGYYSLSIETSNTDYFTSIYGDACDFEEDTDEFDIKLNGLPTLDIVYIDPEYYLRLYTGSAGSNYGGRRDNLDIDTNQFNNFATKITMSAIQSDRVKIILHFDDASSQEHTELIASPTTVEFDFDITADKTIEMISIYYGDSSWNIAAGDRIYVAYIEILETGAEISLTLPEDDYYLSYSTYIESGNVTLTTNDQTIVNNGSITDRWINNFVFTHTSSIVFTVTLDELYSTNFFDNFRIFQTSTTIKTLGSSKYLIESTSIAWDGYKNPLLSGQQTLNTTLLERSSQTSIYSTNLTSTTGLFELEYDQALEQKEYELWTYSYSSGEFNNCSFYFTPSYPHHVNYAETELLDAWDFTEGDTEEYVYSGSNIEISTIDGSLNATATLNHDSYYCPRIIFSSPYIDISDYDHFIMRVKGLGDSVNFRFGVLDIDSNTAYQGIETITNSELTIFEYDMTYYIDGFPDVDLTQIKTFYFYFSNGTTWHSQSIGDGLLMDYFQINYIDSFLEETNDYATDSLLDTWDFEEGDKEGWSPYSYVSDVVENGYWEKTSNTAYSKYYIQNIQAFDETYYTEIVFRIWSDVSQTISFQQKTGGLWGTSRKETPYSLTANTWTTFVVEIAYAFDIDCFIINTDSQATAKKIRLDYVLLLHPEELIYTTIQNSVLLESETNDLQYNLYLDHNFVGVFNDLSLIPLIQTVGTHYFQIQPFRTDRSYITQNVYSYYYIIAATEFTVFINSFYLSDDYANLYVTSNYDCTYEITSGGSGGGNVDKEGTTISIPRIVTPGLEVTLTVEFSYSSETVIFTTKYDNAVTPFYVESYTIDIQEENIQIIWSTSKSTIDSLVINEDGVEVDSSETSPSSWTKSTTVGEHWVTLVFSAPGFHDIIYDFNYEIVSDIFQINIEDYHVGDLFIETHVTASENGFYQVYENNTVLGSEGTLYASGTSIQSDRNTTENALVYYAIKFWDADLNIIWFNTSYSNVEGDFFVIEYSVDIGETTITVTWSTSLSDSDYLTVKEDGANEVTDDETSPSDWPKSNVVGTHSVILIFEADGGYPPITYSFNYHIYAIEDFFIDVGSFQVSDTYICTYASGNYDGNYYVYEDETPKNSGLFYATGTNIETGKNTTAGLTIDYAIKFVYESTIIWFNTTYSNPVTPFYLTDYRVTNGATIVITWDTTLPSLDSLTIYEDGDLKVNADPESTTTWLKNTTVGNHYVTLVFSAEGYADIIHSYAYAVYPPTVFDIDIKTFYVTDDNLNIYLTANFDYTFVVWENGTEIGSGNGMAIGTTIVSPKNNEAGLWNFTIVFTYNSENRTFMTWYSNLIPPLHPLNDLYREQSQGFYNLTLYSNLESYWIDIYHDDSLIIDDSTATFFSIEKGLRVGWHNITVNYIYNVSTNAEGYPVNEYNITLTYEFWYETTFFYNVWIRYIPTDLGLAIGEFNVNWVKTYFDGELVLHGDLDDVESYSNYSYISNYDIRIKNTASSHSLVVKDLFDTVILSTTLDISSFTYKVVKLPIYRLGVINMDNETHKFATKYEPWSNRKWIMSPELPQGVFIQFWFCGGTYGFRIYSATEYVNDAGIKYKAWDKWEDLPPGILPITITIPLVLEGPTTPTETNLSTISTTLALIITVIFIQKKKKKKEVLK